MFVQLLMEILLDSETMLNLYFCTIQTIIVREKKNLVIIVTELAPRSNQSISSNVRGANVVPLSAVLLKVLLLPLTEVLRQNDKFQKYD